MVELENFEVAEDMMIDGLKVVQDTRLYRFTSDSVLLSRFAGAKSRRIFVRAAASSAFIFTP